MEGNLVVLDNQIEGSLVVEEINMHGNRNNKNVKNEFSADKPKIV